MYFVTRLVFVVCGLFCVSSALQAQTNESQLPLSAFSNLPKFTDVELSPNGRRLAFQRNFFGDEPQSMLMTFDLDTGKTAMLIRSDNEKVKFNWFEWVNDDVIMVSARYESRQRTTRYYQTRLYTMRFDAEGEDPTIMLSQRSLERFSKSRHTPQFQDDIIDWLPNDPDHVLIAVDAEIPYVKSVFKMNVNTGNLKRVISGKKRIRHWITDQQSQVRVAISFDYKTSDRTIYLVDDNKHFTPLYSPEEVEERGIFIKGFGLDPNLMYFTAFKDGYRALYQRELTSGQEHLIYEDPGYDIDGSLVYAKATREAIGIRHVNAPGGRHYWIDHYGPLERGLDQALPDFDNTLVSFSMDEQKYLLFVESDTAPGVYLYGDRETGSSQVIFDTYPDIKSEVIGSHDLVEYTTRDGVKIEAYVTLPPFGKAPYPTIVHPHGGPGARDYDGFDTWTAYFSNRGYAVIRPNFRGSKGYGQSFAEAQMKGWGLQMQDDITDATHWMVEQGYADKDKMCIVGASYGGYAALMATVKTPDLFKCAVSFAGVADLNTLVAKHRRFLNIRQVKEQIGDSKKDRTERSPITYVERIKTPILLIHGDEDRVVNVDHSRDMADALDDEDKVFKYVELDAGDHFLSIQRNRTQFYAEVDAFLSDYLK